MQKSPVSKPIVVKSADLPICCPPLHDAIWNAHPRVYLPIEDNPEHRAICPYCGAIYQMQ
ncbi:zinc-finger domain-containing protein [Rhodoferax sp. 4810]|uniref:Zinc-finger domain-containing protein n=1 Tax=Thiospirillum jenense TaxID=1653858 RepID=A0A839HFS9_9GAMM|nr:zinc-finger domain-containing protein [Thiospirillum jenense]MBB1073499.1 zinc-finger domain-containing protein [Rhodoferax jenense]MBB1125987.1 zinc-finger domain-containing protein [Thiospirillum jenense]